MADPSFADIAMRSLGMLGSLGQQNLNQQQTALENQRLQQDNQMRKATQQAFIQALSPNNQPQQGVAPSPDRLSDPLAEARQESDGLMQYAIKNQKLADSIVASGGDIGVAQKLRSDANNNILQARKLMQEARLEQKQRVSQLGQMAAAVQDPESFTVAMDQMKELDPSIDRRYPWDRDPATGQPVYGDRSAKILQTIAGSAETIKDRVTEQSRADSLKQRAAEDEQKRLESQSRIRKNDAQAAKAQNAVKGSSTARASTEDKSDLEAKGAQAATGEPLANVVPGWGTAAVKERNAVAKEALKQIKEEHPGMNERQAGQELAQRRIQFVAGRRSTTQLELMRGMTVQAVGQLDFNVDQATKEMKGLASSDLSPIINAIARGEQKWTGDPKYYSLFFYMHAAAMESARILQGGQASIAQLHQGAAEEAKRWASINMTPASWESVSQAMKAEGKNRIETYDKALDVQRIGNRQGSYVPPVAPDSSQADLKVKVEAAGQKFEPEKYEYRVLPSGEVQRKLKAQ